MCIIGLEQMGYRGIKNRMHCYRRLSRKNAPLMESEKIKEGDPFPPATHEFNEAVDFAPARKPQNGTEFITMSHISEDVATEKERISISEDLTLLFVVEEEIWGRLSSSVQKETSVELEKTQVDPDTWPESSEGVRNLSTQEARDTSPHGHLEEHAAVSSLSSHQSSLVNEATQAQVSSSLSEIAARQGEAQALTVGFSQTLNPEEQDEETILTKSVLAQKASVSHDISKCHQNIKTVDTESDVDHSWEREAQQEVGKEILQCVQPMWDIEVHPHKEGVGQRESNFPTKNEEQKVRDLKGERDDGKSSALHQLNSVSFEDRGINADITQTQPDRILSLISSKRTDDHLDMGEKVEEQGGNSSSLVLHFLAKEEDGEGKSRTHLSKEIIRTRSAESHIDCDQSEADQKDLLNKVQLESTETEAVESEDSRKHGEQEILDCKGTENKMEENDKFGLEHDGQEDQEWDTKETKTSREKVQRNRVTPPVTMDLETFHNVENNSAYPDLNQNNSLAKTEGFSNSLEHVWTLSHCLKLMSGLPESCIQETARIPAESLHSNPKMLPPVCSDSRQLECLGTYDQAACTSHSGHNGEQPIVEDRNGSFETELNENAGDEKRVRDTDGEGKRISCGNLVLAHDPKDQPDLQPEDHPVDVEIHIPPFSLKITKATNQQHENVSKGTSDSIVSNVMLCQESDPLHEMPNQNLPASCQLELVAHDEVTAMDRDIAVQDSSKKATISEEFHENVQDSSSRNPQSVFLGELSDIEQETGELSHVSSWTTRDSEFFQEEDTGINYLQNSQQHLKAPVGTFVFPGKDAGADTPYTEQQISVNESVVLGMNKTEGDHNTDSPASLNISFATATDVTRLTSLLSSVSESNSTHFGQTLLPASDCRQPDELLTHIKALTHTTTAAFLHPRSPSQHEEQLSSPNQTSQFPAPIDSSSHSSASMPDAGVLEQSSPSECDLNQYYQLPESVLSSDESLSLEYDANQTVPMPIVSKNPTAHSMSTTLDASQPVQIVQLDKFNQSRECIATESNKRLPNEVPTYISSPTTIFSSPPSLDMNPFAQHSIGAPAPNSPFHCTEDGGRPPARMPIDNLVSQTTPAVYESNSLSQLHNIYNKMKESCVEELAKSEDAAAPQGQEDQNTPKACRDLRFDLLGKSSDLTTSGNDMAAEDAFSNIPETMSKGMDMFDGKASYHLVEGQKSCKASELRNSRETPSLLAFTNPIHFLQLGPPSPPTKRWPQKQQAVSVEPQWWQANAEIDAEDMAGSMVSQQVVKDPGSLRMELEKSGMEPLPAVILRKNSGAKHLPLEKSSSCPYKNISGSDTKGSVSKSKKQEEDRMKQRAKSKDWHRQGVRKASVPTDSVLEEIAPLVTSKEDTFAQKDKIEHFDRVKYGERETGATVENLTRRRSKLINSSRLLYQEYSDVALNKAIQSQKRDSLSEDVEPGSTPNSPRLRRKVLSPQDSYLQRLSVSSSTSLWQDIPMVRGSTMLLSMTREEQKLQEAKFELIASEASYLRSLNIAVDHFQHSQELQAVLSNQDRQWLFSRLQDVRDVSANFLFDLEEKLEENMFTFNVCDVALRHAPEFRRVYLPYVTNQTYQEQTFKRLMNDVPAFQQVLEKLESDPVCQRLSLKSFLILPFQRITRLKLLLQNILKRTRLGAEEEIQATQAYDALEKLIKDCNENVQRMRSTEELINLSKNMEFECKIFPLISQSRRLVKHGELTTLEYNPGLKWKLTTRSIFLHLFNDYLLLSRPRENGRFIVFDYSASSDVRGEKCEMKLHGTSKNVFRLFLLRNNQGKKVEFLFRTETQSEKLRWISALSPQQTELDLLDDSDAPQVQCVKSYKSRENDELALEKADIVMVLRQSSDAEGVHRKSLLEDCGILNHNRMYSGNGRLVLLANLSHARSGLDMEEEEGWIEGVRLSDGERGWFPSDQVEFISSKHIRQMNLKEEQRVQNAKQQFFHRK